MENNPRRPLFPPLFPDGFDNPIIGPRPRRIEDRRNALIGIFGRNNPPERARELAELTIADEEAERENLNPGIAFRRNIAADVNPGNGIAEDRARAIALARARMEAGRLRIIANDNAEMDRARAIARDAIRDRESSGEEKSYEPDEVRPVIQMGGSKRRNKRRRTSKRRRTTRRRTIRRR